ncbi:TPA: hypothetical protein ACH3X2_000268 [Trebouxia sp. C0005]
MQSVKITDQAIALFRADSAPLPASHEFSSTFSINAMCAGPALELMNRELSNTQRKAGALQLPGQGSLEQSLLGQDIWDQHLSGLFGAAPSQEPFTNACKKVGTFWDASRPLIKAPHEPHHSGLHHFIHHEGKAQISYPIHKFTVVARQLSILAEN